MSREDLSRRYAELCKQHGKQEADNIPIATWNDLLNDELELEHVILDLQESHAKMRQSLENILANLTNNIDTDTIDTLSLEQARFKLHNVNSEINLILYHLEKEHHAENIPPQTD